MAGLCPGVQPLVLAKRPLGKSGRDSWKQHWHWAVAPMSATSGQHKHKCCQASSPRSRPELCLYVPTGALQIESSEESDQGKYECVATNSAGTRYSAPANLYVRGKDTGRAWPCLHGAELPLPGVLP